MAILAAIVIVDFRRLVIPDLLNLALAGSGLLLQLVTDPDRVPFQVAFAFVTLALFWCIRQGYVTMTGRIGLGLGDVKMFGAAALWISPLLFPVLIFIASAAALLFVAGQAIARGSTAARSRVPFGPFIALGLATTWSVQYFVGSSLEML